MIKTHDENLCLFKILDLVHNFNQRNALKLQIVHLLIIYILIDLECFVLTHIFNSIRDGLNTNNFKIDTYIYIYDVIVFSFQ